MQAIPYERLKETLYYEQLPNGLSVYILPKEGFQKAYATFSTKYGSVDNRFQVQGGTAVSVPDGIAHFLEHKMFEEPEGDVFMKFASHGASANAFTSFDRTAYLFSATEHIGENVQTLLDFVQNPYFTDENVEKEKGIIGQEINMYQDNADWRVYFGLIEALYRVHPIHIDIAGTVESIGRITKDLLYECYHTFYHPSNMLLFVVGGVEPDQMMTLIRNNQARKTFRAQGEITRFFDEEPLEVNVPRKEIRLPVSMPKCLFGLKESAPSVEGKELIKRELLTKLVLDVLIGPSSSLYQELYDSNLITDGFGHEYNCSRDYAFSIIGGDSRDPDEMVAKLRSGIDEALHRGLDKAEFERIRRKRIGGVLRMMNSPEAVANEFTKYRFRGADLFELVPIYESFTLAEADERMRRHFDWSKMSLSVVGPGIEQA